MHTHSQENSIKINESHIVHFLDNSKIYEENIPLSRRIDFAWAVYSDPKSSFERLELALNFLIYAYDLDVMSSISIQDQLVNLMQEKAQYSQTNPEYIPGKAAGNLQLKPEFLNIKQTQSVNASGKDEAPGIRAEFEQRELLDVNQDSRNSDAKEGMRYLTNDERAAHQVHINNQIFVQNKKPFSTRDYISHGKKGFASYVLTANGQLFIFNHHNGQDKICHSSMNAGAPVISAGEIMIENGMLRAITPHSGHYQPRIFNTYRTLEYFAKHKVNIRNTSVLTREDPCTITKKNTPLVKICGSTGLVYLKKEQLNTDYLNNHFDKSQYIISENKIYYYSKIDNSLDKLVLDPDTVDEIKTKIPETVIALSDAELKYLMTETSCNPEGVFYSTPASDFYNSMNQMIRDNIQSMMRYVQEYKEGGVWTTLYQIKDAFLGSSVTDRKIKLAENFIDELDIFQKTLNASMTREDLDKRINELDGIISVAQAKNASIDNNGRLSAGFGFFKNKVQEIQAANDPTESIKNMKRLS